VALLTTASLTVATFALFALPVLVVTACSESAISASSTDRLAVGTTYSADLDGDSDAELLLVDGSTASVTITDGDTVYNSRPRWQVVEACLGDIDHNGLLEVVTLLDSDDGRHVGLFAYFGGEYRERLVTSVLIPRPLSLQVIHGPASSGDLLVLTEEPASGETETQTVTYRWNGFGLTVVEPPLSP
jgi:hypothetical protein